MSKYLPVRFIISAISIVLLLFGFTAIQLPEEIPIRPVPVLCYHDISPNPESKWSRTPAQLEKDFAALASHGFQVISLEQYLENRTEYTSKKGKWIVLTFDDATTGQFTLARPLLKKFHYPATFYVPTRAVEDQQPVSTSYSGVMQWQDLQILVQEGFQIASHSRTHRSFADLNEQTIRQEIAQSLQALHEHLGITSRDLCLPYGEYLPKQEDIFPTAGIRSIALTTTDHGSGNPELIKIRRFEVKAFTSQQEIIDVITGRP